MSIKIGIDVLADVPGMGGAVNIHRNLLKYLPKIQPNWEFYVFCTPSLEKYYKLYGVNHKNINWISCWWDNNNGSMKRILTQEIQIPYFAKILKLDCMLTRPEPYSFRILNIVTIFRYTTLIPENCNSIKQIYRRHKLLYSASNTSLILCNSNWSYKNLKRYLKGKLSKHVVINESFDKKIFDKSKFILEKYVKPDIKEIIKLNKKKIIVPTGIQKRKNSEVIFDTIRLLDKNRINNICFIFMGSNENIYFKYIKNNYIDLIKSDKVFIMGFRSHEEIAFVAKHSIIGIYPSKKETFGVPPLEMMSIGLPTIISDIDVLREISGEGALLFNPNSPKELFKCILKLISDPKFRVTVGEKGKRYVKNYSWFRNAKKTAKLIKNIIKTS